jgi:hypothetical protein
MRKASKSPNGAFDSNNAPHENQKCIQTQTSDAMETASDPMPNKSVAGELSAGEVTLKERHQLIAEAAYFRAERRNFAPGCELTDWLDAEAEIEIMNSHPS